MRSTQGNLFSSAKKSLEHGGDLGKGKRKTARPLCTKRPMHLVLRSEKAKGEWHLHQPQNWRLVGKTLDEISKKTGVKILGYQNVGNHLHVVILGKTRRLLKEFLRLLPQRISIAITGAKKGNPQGRFFDAILFTRVVEWGRAYKKMKAYLFKNALESVGFSPAEVKALRVRSARLTPPGLGWT